MRRCDDDGLIAQFLMFYAEATTLAASGEVLRRLDEKKREGTRSTTTFVVHCIDFIYVISFLSYDTFNFRTKYFERSLLVDSAKPCFSICKSSLPPEPSPASPFRTARTASRSWRGVPWSRYKSLNLACCINSFVKVDFRKVHIYFKHL